MQSFKRRFDGTPQGTAALFFIQIFSTLVLYATKHLMLSVKAAATLMGRAGAFHSGLHLFDGYLGGCGSDIQSGGRESLLVTNGQNLRKKVEERIIQFPHQRQPDSK